ncbi:CocE/NonD family hydrolase [Mucilaginibacter sp. UR6-11]|uniref:CocE/NonD family hydrolase n=1 Tax=Mucilaginibacter sp. UR6-11 TaxID=1435644 RepID=UPI001E614194|nr:CocE/NonD family hydrolase [Mucilaginibacter sp. UR6-11]
MAIFLLSLFILPTASSQQIYFSRKIPADSTTLSQHMFVLSGQLIKNLAATARDKRDGEYYGCLFAVQALTHKYKESNQSIDSLRLALKTTGVPEEDSQGYLNIYEAYNHIKLMRASGDKRSEQEIFKWALPIVLGNFKGQAFAYATEPYSHDAAAIETEWQTALAKVQARQSDSLSIDSAIMFAQAYLQHLVYKPFLAIGKKAAFKADNANFIIQDSAMITMRDGAKLAAVIVRDRKLTAPQPVVMMSNIYAGTEEINLAKEIAGRGYVGVILNTRGKYASDVSIEPWEHDAEDGYDAIDWISKQSWCNGKVGMYGGSYLGFSQWAAAKKLHPALKTIVPQAAAAPGIDFPMHNSVFTTYALRWVSNVTKNKLTDWKGFFDTADWNASFNKWYTAGQAYNALDSVNGQSNTIFQRWLQHPSYDKYWQSMIPYQQEFSKINIPVLTITGYFDGDQLGALYYYKQHHLWNPSANHYLVIGPFDHAGAQGSPSAVVNGYTIDQVAKIDINKLVFQWFDFVLKGGVKPDLLKNTVNYQVMGTNEWWHAASLEKMSSRTLDFYLSTEKEGKFNKLANKKTGGHIAQAADFSKRVIADFKDSYSMFSDTLNSKDALTFVSDKLQSDVVIAGSFTGDLMALTNKKDMDIALAVIVQDPFGKYSSLSSAFQRASYSKNNSRRQLLKPGVKEAIPITGNFTGKKVLKGSRIIVQVSVLNNAAVEVNYGTGKDVATETIADAKQPLQIKWFGDSLIRIPIVSDKF